jgi:tRNA threonylcarbamoyl adenosine modification protein YeaZ
VKILALDTSTKFLCLGLYDGSKIYEYNLELGRKNSSLLVVTIKRALEALGWHVRGIDYFACGLGPGSFTGIRVGLATIKGLSWSQNKPVIGISTLDILAKNARIDNGLVVPIVDAKRNLIYCSNYKAKNGNIKRISPYMLLNENELLKKIKKNAVILGDALNLYKENILKSGKGVTILDRDYWYPKAHNIIILALERIKHRDFDTPFDIEPIYLYPKECQIRGFTQIKSADIRG